jgi:hypothetical protein
MASSVFHIKINSSEQNMDNGFYTLMASGASIVCLKGEEYVVPAEAISKLNEKNIIYELVVEKKGVDKTTEKIQDATKT